MGSLDEMHVESRPLAPELLYEKEAAKRLRHDGVAQFIDLDGPGGPSVLLRGDPWAIPEALNTHASPVLQDGTACKFLIVGAGFGGLIAAVKLIQAGFAADSIRFVDAAGGFGGAWYWNRFPGLLCDVESYIYMPFLEETGYTPRSRYASGDEILEHANRIAAQYHLTDKASFHTAVRGQRWDEGRKRWTISLERAATAVQHGEGAAADRLTVTAQFVILACAGYGAPQIPNVPGLSEFGGKVFHTARWDYAYTGGVPTNPQLDRLKDKTVGIIGTGATAVQVIPFLARWAKKVNVFQRTPSNVVGRPQRATNPAEWAAKIATKPGWQAERRLNWLSYASNTPNGPNLVGDIWTETPSFSAVLGAPNGGIMEMGAVPEHLARLYALDLPAAEKARARVQDLVNDPKVAAKLQAWYPTWCKRVTLSDDYLQTFNQPHVELVDTDGKGVERITERGVVVAGEEYPLDVLILSTGFRAPLRAYGNPATRLGLAAVIGREGVSLEDKWQRLGAATLHGVCSHGFPNLFFVGPAQGGYPGVMTVMLEAQMQHIAYIIRKAHQTAGADADDVLAVEPSQEAEEAWSFEVVKRSLWFSSMGGCTPSYPEEMTRIARTMMWGEGFESYANVLRAWEEEGNLAGVTVSCADAHA
jgi:cation diffusion facilitator CzcD-associated flavoprotein CzcO